MYNKYFTMKRSELKEAIKNEITSVLSENVNPAFDKKIANFAKKINNEMGYQGGVLEAMKQIKSRLERIISKVEGAKRGGAEEEPLMKMIGLIEGKRGVVVDPDEIMMHINQYQSGNIDGDDLAQAIEEILVAMMSTPLREAKSAADVDKEVKAKKAEMVKKAKEYKAAEGEKKEKIKDELKKMTAERDELEKKVKDLKKKEEKEAEDIGRGQELKV